MGNSAYNNNLANSSSSSSGASSSYNPQQLKGCPVAHNKPSAAEPAHHSTNSPALNPHNYYNAAAAEQVNSSLPSEGDVIPSSAIPASSHQGNSSDGSSWLNPSANQLYRALARKNKSIEPHDALAVANIHQVVTDNTWLAIMEYESRYSAQCKEPKLLRFYGMDGVYSAKAKLMNWLRFSPLPFDRHDWIVDRCGKQVKYIIDYYSLESVDSSTGETEIAYFIDARPAPDMRGLADRAAVAW
jgi:cytochrome c heme-lyase